MKSQASGSVLIVRHGEGRGRIPSYGQHILDWLEVERPDLWAQTRLHATGDPPPKVEELAGVVFWLADPLERLYPQCYREAVTLQRQAEARDLPMVNRPTVLGSYGKARQADQWLRAGLPTPPLTRVDSIDDIRSRFPQDAFPLLVRGSFTFSQRGTIAIRSSADLQRISGEDLPSDAVVTPLIDVRQGFRNTRPRGLCARFHHKKRALLIHGEVVPDSLFFSREPVVSIDTSLLTTFKRRQQALRRCGPLGRRASKRIFKGRLAREVILSEREFIGSPILAADTLRRAGEVLGLEFLGIDYADLADGGILLWEANPYPFIPAVRATPLHRLRPTAEKLERVYRAFAHCVSGILGQFHGDEDTSEDESDR